jgi:hypothetical protein
MQCWKYTFKKAERHYVLEIHEDGYMQLAEGDNNALLFDWKEDEFDDVVSTVRSALRDFRNEMKKREKKASRKLAG